MATRATREQFRSAADAPSKRSAPPTAKRGAIAEAKMGLRSRTALEDIGNRAAKPKVRVAYRRSAVQGGRRRQPIVRSARARARGYVVTGRPPRMAFKEFVPPPPPNPSPEPFPEPETAELSQPKPQPPATMAKFRYTPTEEMLCQAFSHVILEPGDVDVEDGDDANLCSSYVKDIYKYLRNLEFQIYKMEMRILKALDFFLDFPLPLQFLRRASKIAEVDSKQYVLAKYLMELCVVDYDIDHFPLSRIAAAVFCLPLKFLNGCELLPSLQHYIFYTENDLLSIMQYMAKIVVLVNKDVATRRLEPELEQEQELEPELELEQEQGRAPAQPQGGHDTGVLELLRLRDQMKRRLMDYSAAIRGGQTTFLDQVVEEKHVQSTTEDFQINKGEIETTLWNKTLALQRIQLMAALRNKVNQGDEDSCLILKTVNRIVLLSQAIMKYQQLAHEKKQKLIDIKRKRLSLKKDQGRKLQQIQNMKKKQKKERGNMNLIEAQMLQNLEKERAMTTVIQNVFQNIIIGSGVNWAKDPSLKAIVLQLEKNVHVP